MIDILIPVLGRPQNAQRVVYSIRATCDYPVVFLCSPHDEKQIAACLETGERTVITSWMPGRGDFARKINHGFDVTDSQYIFMGADDLDFEQGWDRHALAVGMPVVGTNDMANSSVKRGKFSTHCLIQRQYILEQGGSADGPGTVLHKGYDHNFVDRELCGVAQHRGVWGFSKKSVVRHRHPLWKSAPDDATYQKSLRRFHQDRALFIERSALWGGAGLSQHETRASRYERTRNRRKAVI